MRAKLEALPPIEATESNGELILILKLNKSTKLDVKGADDDDDDDAA
jgi:hypothetical protein